MELEIITPKKEKKFEPVTIQLTIHTPEEFATLLAVANCGALSTYLSEFESVLSKQYGVKMSPGLFKYRQLDVIKEIFRESVTNQSK